MSKHIVCFSGGHSSALVAIEVVRRYGKEGVTLLNHDINPRVEDADIKRFKREVAACLGLPITFASYADPEMDQFDVAMKHSAFKVGGPQDVVICTDRLKTEPFKRWLREHCPTTEHDIRKAVEDHGGAIAEYRGRVDEAGFRVIADAAAKRSTLIAKRATVYYGFDASERVRIQRRSTEMARMGYRVEFPLAHWERTIQSTTEIGIDPPLTYGMFKHANCIGCIKAGAQHWYAVYCTRPDVWAKAKGAEGEIGHSIMRGQYLEELEPKFQRMKCAGIQPTEHIPQQRFWADVRKVLGRIEAGELELLGGGKPCECVV